MKKHAVLIGINKYKRLGQLRYARQDAEAVADALKRCYGFSGDEITLLTDANESKNAPEDRFVIEEALSPDFYANDLDLFVFGFWGHGIWENDNRYLCPMNVRDGRLTDMALPLNTVQAALGRLRVKNICLILDCCQNEVSTEGRNAAQTMTAGEEKSLDLLARDIVLNLKKKTADPDYDPTVVVLNSCKKGERAFESAERRHGLFTAELLEAMEKRGKSTSELCEYVLDSVPKLLRTTGVHQTPYYTCAGEANILLPAVKKGYEEPEELKEEKQTRQKAKQTSPASLTVPTDVPTLAEAYAKIPEEGAIFLKHDVRKVPKTITITKKVTITKDVNHPEYVVLQGGEESVVHLQSGFAEIAGMTIQNEGKEGSLFVSNNAVQFSTPLGALHDCVFTSKYGNGFVVNTKDSNPNMKNCVARNCGGSGFYIGSGASGTFRRNKLSGNVWQGKIDNWNVSGATSDLTDSGREYAERVRRRARGQGGDASLWAIHGSEY